MLVNFPTGLGQPPKRRPAVVVQSNHNNSRFTNSIFAMITSNVSLAGREAAQVLIDLGTPAGQQSGLRHTSAVKCENLHTLPISATRKIGSLPNDLMEAVDDGLRASLGIA